MVEENERSLDITVRVAKGEYNVNLRGAKDSACGFTLIQQRWYWGNAPRELIELAMQDQQEGSFIIRDASTKGDFTLTLKVRGTDRLIKILCRNGRCGFNLQSLEFETVMELVDAHQECTLAEYNPDLNVPLAFPVGRIISLGSRSSKLPVDDTYKRIYMALRCHTEGLIAEYERISSLFDNLFWRKISLEDAIEDRVDKVYQSEEIVGLLKKNLDIMKKNENTIAAWVLEAFKKTLRRVERHTKHYVHMRPQMQADNAILSEYLDLVNDAMEGMESEVINAYEVVEDWKQLIVDHGLPKTDIDQIVEDVRFLVNIEPVSMSQILLEIPVKWDATNWFSVNSNKEHATSRILSIVESMEGDTDGVFLIRPSASRDSCFVLSISLAKKVHHCLIEYRNEPAYGDEVAGFAFLDTHNFFPTLVDFVKFYSVYTLRDHNEVLDTTLKRPAFRGNRATNYI